LPDENGTGIGAGLHVRLRRHEQRDGSREHRDDRAAQEIAIPASRRRAENCDTGGADEASCRDDTRGSP
jgi:hypothetical protein